MLLINVVYLIILQLIDFMVAGLFHSSFGFVTITYIPLMSFVGFELLCSDFSLQKTIIFAVIFGVIQDVLFANIYISFTLIYVIISIITYYLNKRFNDNYVSKVIVLSSIVLLREIIVYINLRFLGIINLNIFNFFNQRLVYTIFINVFLIIAVIFLNHIRINFVIKDEYNRRLSEDLFGYSYSMKGEHKE